MKGIKNKEREQKEKKERKKKRETFSHHLGGIQTCNKKKKKNSPLPRVEKKQ